MRRILSAAVSATLALGLATPGLARNPTAQERADIENLAYRYIFALDWRDSETYANTFAPDGVLNYGGGQAVGRDEIREVVETIREREAARSADEAGQGSQGQHFVTSMVIDVSEDGQAAVAQAYWIIVSGAEPRIGAYGHYVDELAKIDGEWLYTSRRTYNEQSPGRGTTPLVNPVTNPGHYGITGY